MRIKKMKFLKVNRHISALIGICSLSKESSLPSRIVQMICTISIFATLVPYVALSALCAVEYFQSGDIENSLFALIQVLGVFLTFISSVSLLTQRKNLGNFFDRMQMIFDKCTIEIEPSSIQFYLMLSQFIR